MINQFKATVKHSIHCSHRLVCWSILWWKQNMWLFRAVLTFQCEYFFTETMRLVPGQIMFNVCLIYTIVSLFLYATENIQTHHWITFVLPFLQIHANNTECVYWDWRTKDWSSEGCTYLGETPNWQRICECDHLTNFAVLMVILSYYKILKHKGPYSQLDFY